MGYTKLILGQVKSREKIESYRVPGSFLFQILGDLFFQVHLVEEALPGLEVQGPVQLVCFDNGPGLGRQDVDPMAQVDGFVDIMADKEGGELDFFHNLQIPVVHFGLGNGIQFGEGLV